MTVQDIITDVVRDSDNTIGTTHGALIGYVDRVHKDLLRASRWRFLLSAEQWFKTEAGEPDYWVGPTAQCPSTAADSELDLQDFDKIHEQYVFDRTNDRRLFRVLNEPLSPVVGVPTTFRLEGQTLSLYNMPKDVYDISFRYYAKRKVLTATTDVLQIPDDYKDVVVAGVNELGSMLQNRDDDVIYWRQIYQLGKRDMIRDSHPLGIDFIHPDPTSATGGYISYPVDPNFPNA